MAYEVFLRAVAPRIRGLVRARAGLLGSETCEDIVQETLLAIHLKRHTWREDAPVQPWLWAIAHHKVADAFRTRGQTVHLTVDEVAKGLAAHAPDPAARIDLERLLAQLDLQPAAIVQAMSIEGVAAAAAGARWGLGEGAVRVGLHRALARLRTIAGRAPRKETLR